MLITQKNKDFKTIFYLFCYSVIFCFLFLRSSPLFEIHTGLDQNIYFNIAKEWVNGKLPYRDTFDQKGILLYVVYTIVYSISKSSFLGLFIVEILTFTLITYYTYKLSNLFLDSKISVFIALLCPIIMTPTALGGGTAEEFICLFQIVCLYYFFNVQFKRDSIPLFFLTTGISIAATFFIKYNLVIFFIPFIISLWIYICKYDSKKTFKSFLYFSIGISIITIPIIIYFSITRTLFYFIGNYIVFNLKYSTENIIPAKLLFAFLLEYIKLRWILFPIVLFGILYFTFSKRIKYLIFNRYALAFAFCILYLMLFATFRPYYYLSLYILFPLGAISLFLLINRYINLNKYPRLTTTAILILPLAIGLHINRNLFNEKRLSQEEVYSDLINYIIEDEKTDHNQILSLGLSTIVQTYTNADPSFKYFFYPNISYKSYPEIRDYQDSIIINKKATYIISYSDSYYFQSYYRYFKPLYTNYEFIFKGIDDIENRAYYLFKIRKE